MKFFVIVCVYNAYRPIRMLAHRCHPIVWYTVITTVSWLPVLSNMASPNYKAKQQPTKCFRALRSIQTGLLMLMCSNIRLLGLPHDAQFGQTWHLSTQLRCRERTGRRVLWLTITTVTDPTISQVSSLEYSVVVFSLKAVFNLAIFIRNINLSSDEELNTGDKMKMSSM